jgi:hypothetical protein
MVVHSYLRLAPGIRRYLKNQSKRAGCGSNDRVLVRKDEALGLNLCTFF